MPWINKADDYQIRDDVSWTKGAHQLKLGGSWALYKKIQDYFANTQGNFTFNGTYTTPSAAQCTPGPNQTCGSDYADFLLGLGQSTKKMPSSRAATGTTFPGLLTFRTTGA